MVDTTAIAPFLEAHKQNIAAFKAVDSRLAAVEGDQEKAIKSWMEGSDEETAVKLREAIAEATRRLRTLAESSVVVEDLSEADKEKLSTERAMFKEKLQAGSRSLRKLIDAFNLELDANELLKEMGDPTATRVNAAGASAGSGLPRASVNVTCYKKHEPNGDKWTFENLSKSADFLDLPVEEMQKIYAQAGGVSHEDIKTIKTPQNWDYTNPTTGTVWVVNTTPKDTAPRGRKAVAKPNPTQPKDPQELPAS